MGKDLILTSVKIQPDLFENFKVECVRRKFSFQKLADRAVYLYLTDPDFRQKITNQNTTEL
jgi:predicted transcriptional regulator